jgi:Ca2+-binding RTX toxin-like protein
MKFAFAGIVLCALAGTANATTSTFNGTSGVDTIVVGRGYNNGGTFIYLACINGTWHYGNAVTGSSDVVTTYGYGGGDFLTVRAASDLYTCGSEMKWFYRMDTTYACPGTLTVYGGDGNDRIYGGQCAEQLYGDAGADTIFGGLGNDSIYGGIGDDCIEDSTLYSLSCGDGADSYTDEGIWKGCETHITHCYVIP